MKGMTLAERQQQLIARYALIEDPQERLAAVVERARKLAPLAEEERCDANRVQGCTSRVWLLGAMEEGRCRFRLDADSTLVKGLAALLCEASDGGEAWEIAASRLDVLEALRLTDHLSPTRRHGLAQVARTIRDFAQRQLP